MKGNDSSNTAQGEAKWIFKSDWSQTYLGEEIEYNFLK